MTKQQLADVSRFLSRIFLWHLIGSFYGALGLGLAFGASGLFEGTPGPELYAGPLYMMVIGLIFFVLMTPIALLLLSLWTLAARRFPALEPRRGVVRLGVLLAVAFVMMVPLAVGLISLFGYGSGEETRSEFVIIWEMMAEDWTFPFYFLPAAAGWFTAPRFLVPSLWSRFTGSAKLTAPSAPVALSSAPHAP